MCKLRRELMYLVHASRDQRPHIDFIIIFYYFQLVKGH